MHIYSYKSLACIVWPSHWKMRSLKAFNFGNFHVSTTLCVMTPFKTHWINSKMHGGQPENKTVFLSLWKTGIWEVWGFHLPATIFESTHSEYQSNWWHMWKDTANCSCFCLLTNWSRVQQALTHIQASKRTLEMMVQREILSWRAADPTPRSTPVASTPTCSASEPRFGASCWGQTIWSG